MVAQLLSFDQQLFVIINNLPHPLWLTGIFWLFSSVYRYFIWLVFIYWVIRKTKKSIVIPLVVIVFIGSSFIANGIFKPLVGRLRPEFVIPNIKTYVSVSDYFSYISGHAVTSFSLAYILSEYYPAGTGLFFLFALVISISRVYLGVHYPLDVIVGGIIGVIFAYFVNLIAKANFSKIVSHYFKILVIILLFLLFHPGASAITIVDVGADTANIYQEEQVLGAATDKAIPIPSQAQKINIMDKIINIGVDEGKMIVSIMEKNGQIIIKETIDKIRLDNGRIKNLVFNKINNQLLISDKFNQVKTSLPLSFDQKLGQLTADINGGKKNINYLPDEVVTLFNKAGIYNINKPLDIELTKDQSKIVYRVIEVKDKKLFGFIPISFNLTTNISADTGSITRKISLPIFKFPKS